MYIKNSFSEMKFLKKWIKNFFKYKKKENAFWTLEFK